MNNSRRVIQGTYLEGFLYALMVGSAESFALYYAVNSGIGLVQLGALSTVPVLMGSIAQWLSPYVLQGRSLRRVMLSCFGLQSIGILCLAMGVVSGRVFEWMIVGLCFYWVGGHVSGPLWLEWVAQQMPRQVFRNYLGKRNGFVNLATIFSYFAAAALISDHQAYTEVFVFGAAVRFAALLVQGNISQEFFSREEALHHPHHSSTSRYAAVVAMIILTVFFRTSVNFSAPFFLPYMTQVLGLNLVEYVVLTAMPFLGRYMFLSNWARASGGLRPFIGLQLSALGIATLPSLWIFLEGQGFFPYLILEFVSGVLWGGFELCMILIIQQLWPGKIYRAQSAHLALMNLGALSGAMIGAQLLGEKSNFTFAFHLSSAFRGVVALVMIGVFYRMKISRVRARDMGAYLITVLSIRPSPANVGRILFGRSARRRERLGDGS